MLRLSGNHGFITNSSSVVHHFPKAMLEHSRIKAFIEAYGIVDGYVGKDLWHRGQCSSFAVSHTQKEQVNDNLNINTGFDFDTSSVPIDVDGDQVVIIYGDEYPGLTMELAYLFREVAEELGMNYGMQDYN